MSGNTEHLVTVSTDGGQYPIHIGTQGLSRLAKRVPADATAIVVVTNPTVAHLYEQQVREALAALDVPVSLVTLPDGEAHKDLTTLNTIFDHMLGIQLDRRAVLIALGGGVVGDMAGFAAAVYMRGIRFIQVPTTLLAQVDSSVGGKTAVNHSLGKNMIGAFYQPVAVEIDTNVLATLPDREISAGLAEVVKYGLIMDEPFFNWCEANASGLRERDSVLLTEAIRKSCEFKAQIVSQDEREGGIRAILNLGHTFGHAIEAGLGYGQWLHGEAVGCGMVLAAALSEKVCGLAPQAVARIRSVVEAIGCPTKAPPLGGFERWLHLMRGDKKAEGGEINFILMPKIGQAIVSRAPMEALEAVIAENSEQTTDQISDAQVPRP